MRDDDWDEDHDGNCGEPDAPAMWCVTQMKTGPQATSSGVLARVASRNAGRLYARDVIGAQHLVALRLMLDDGPVARAITA
jgi:hypothetical protein